MNLQAVSWLLLVVGGVNWGLVGLGGFMGENWNIVNLIFGAFPTFEWLVYVVVGAAAVYSLINRKDASA